MTTREDLIEAGTRAVCDWDPDYDPADEDTRAAVGVVADAVEGLIRADERIKALFTASTVHRDEWADLRAKVETLPKAVYQWDSDYISRAAVLALLDGGSDDQR